MIRGRVPEGVCLRCEGRRHPLTGAPLGSVQVLLRRSEVRRSWVALRCWRAALTPSVGPRSGGGIRHARVAVVCALRLSKLPTGVIVGYDEAPDHLSGCGGFVACSAVWENCLILNVGAANGNASITSRVGVSR